MLALLTKKLGDPSACRGGQVPSQAIDDLLLLSDRVPDEGHVHDQVGRHRVLGVERTVERVRTHLAVVQTSRVTEPLPRLVRDKQRRVPVSRQERAAIDSHPRAGKGNRNSVDGDGLRIGEQGRLQWCVSACRRVRWTRRLLVVALSSAEAEGCEDGQLFTREGIPGHPEAVRICLATIAILVSTSTRRQVPCTGVRRM